MIVVYISPYSTIFDTTQERHRRKSIEEVCGGYDKSRTDKELLRQFFKRKKRNDDHEAKLIEELGLGEEEVNDLDAIEHAFSRLHGEEDEEEGNEDYTVSFAFEIFSHTSSPFHSSLYCIIYCIHIRSMKCNKKEGGARNGSLPAWWKGKRDIRLQTLLCLVTRKNEFLNL